jgi:hypothetical protein
VDYKSLVAQLMTERNRLDRAISLLQTLDEEQSSEFIADPQTRTRGRPLGSRNKVKLSMHDLPQDSNGQSA